MIRIDSILRKLIRSLVCFILLAHMTLAHHDSIPLQFSSGEFRDVYYSVLAFGTPLAVLALATLDYVRHRKSRLIVLNTMVGIFLCVVSCLTIFIAAIYGGDNWVKSGKTLYKHRFSQEFIIERNSDGGWGNMQTFKIKPIIPFFHWSREIDIDKINPLAWIPESSD